jgi:hypothetical protein
VAPFAYAVAAFLRPGVRTAQVEWHLAIVDPLLVARLDAEPLLRGAGRLDVARFGVGTRYRTGRSQRHQQEERPRHDADWSTQHHLRPIGHRRAFWFDRSPVFSRDSRLVSLKRRDPTLLGLDQSFQNPSKRSEGNLVLATDTPLGSSTAMSSAQNTIETVFAFDETIFRLPLLNPLSQRVTNGRRVVEKEQQWKDAPNVTENSD